MQTTINTNMAFGIPGTHGNGQPYFADPYIAGAEVTMGGVAAIDANGNAVPYSVTNSTPVGIFVNPNEHVRMVLPSADRSLAVAAGSTVAIAKKGAWYVAVPTADKANWVKGAKIKYDSSSYGLLVDASGTVAEILAVDAANGVALIRFL